MNENEPLMKCQDNANPVQTAGLLLPEDLRVAATCMLALGGWHKGGMISIQAYLWNRGSHY